MTREDGRIEHLRMPPQSVEAEQAVLGGIMLSPKGYDLVGDILQPEDFYRQDHQLIYRAIQELGEKKRRHDAVTLGEWFESNGLSEHVAGGAYLVELASTTPSAANIIAYAEIVKDKATLRRLIEVGTGIVNAGFEPSGRDSHEIVAEAEQAVLAIGAKEVTTSTEAGLQGLKRTYLEMERRRALGSKMLGMPTSLSDLDRLTLGLQPDDLIILAARPSMGKTALMGQLRREAALRGYRPFTIEMEMSAEQLYMRDVAALSGVSINKVKLPATATPEEVQRIYTAFKTMKEWAWWLDDTPSLTVQQLITRVRRAKKQHDIGIVFIDYLQYVDISKLLRHGVTSAIQEVTRALKALAKELHIPIVLLSQLNRSLETRTDKRPVMSDLRESGAIEQDADMVIFIHRQGYFERDWGADDPRQMLVEVIVAKARNGETGVAKARWEGQYQRFTSLAWEDEQVYSQLPKRNGGFQPDSAHYRNRPVSTGLVSVIQKPDTSASLDKD